MAALTCDICNGNLSMDASGEFAVCESCGMKHTKDRIKAKVQGIEGSSVEQMQTASVVIPPKFRNAAFEPEKRSLLKKIDDISRENIILNDRIEEARNVITRCKEEMDNAQQEMEHVNERALATRIRSAGIWADNPYDPRYRELQNKQFQNTLESQYKIKDTIDNAQTKKAQAEEEIKSLNSKISENKRKEITYNAQLRDLDAILQKPETQRVEEYYQSLMNKKHTANDTDVFAELVKEFRELGEYKDAKAQAEECVDLGLKQTYNNLLIKKEELDSAKWAELEHYTALAKFFREMDGYADTAELANDCEDLAIALKYHRLVKEKNNASSENEFQDLAKRFRAMNGYKDTAELAKECENLAIEVKYNRLVKEKNNASSENEYQDLAKQFRAMNGYKNTAELANECDNRCRELKEQREERERVEREQRLEIEYNMLVEAKNKASTQKEYQDLAGQFRAMNGYKDTAELAEECDNLGRELKERYEEEVRKDIEKAQREKKNRQIIGIISAAALAICAVTTYYLTRPTVENLFDTGKSYYRVDKFKNAVKYFTKAVKRNPHDADFRCWRGKAHLGMKNYEAAAADFREAARLAPNVVEYYYFMADVYSGMKDYDNVVAAYSQAIRLEPDNPEHYFNKAEANSEKKAYSAAIADYTEAIRLDPSDPRFYNTRGSIYRQVEDYAQAIADHTEAIRLNPSDARYHNNRGVAYHISKNYPAAITNYGEAIRLAPDNARYRNNRGAVHSLNKNYAAAADDFREALQLDPGSAQYRANLEAAEEQLRKRRR